ncbi:MAG: COX15/CtaA family protein [Myxococcaceae bacterium]|nr:COX15/CtaA family protein [Myxococcaceae bacterium]
MVPSPRRSVGLWLLAVAAAVVVQVVLGGITRLTDSGLSITEWKPILGVVPPTDDAGWAEAFGKYQQIPQFQRLKSHLSLDEFKVIYFWEWFHRLWGRLLGLFFVVPMVVFWRRGQLEGLKGRALGLLALGGAQGVMGWVMVASGLQELVYVSHLRLAAHFLLAAVLLGWLVALGVACLDARPVSGASASSRWASGLLAVLFVQFAWGAFMAGLKAVLAAPTWPTINGQWVPNGLFGGGGWWWNDPLAVHLIHRSLGYALVLGVLVFWWRSRLVLGASRHAALAVVALQVSLGVLVTVNAVVPARLLWLGVAHQVTGLGLMVALVVARARALRAAPARAEASARSAEGGLLAGA